MLTRFKAGVARAYYLALQVADDWWQLGVIGSLLGSIWVNILYLPIKNGVPASTGELAALFASATGLVATHVVVRAWKQVNGDTNAS